MKHLIAAAASALCLAGAASASSVDTTLWSGDIGPSWNFGAPVWTTPTSTSVNAFGNNAGSYLSDFSATGDFTFAMDITATGGDNDNIGAVLGWIDSANNIRIGFEGGGFGDCGNQGTCAFPYFANGFWIVQEVAGVATTLYEETAFSFVTGVVYDLSVSVVGGALSFDFEAGGSSIYSGSVNPTAPTDGKVGVYVESQAGRFENIAYSPIVSAVPLPASSILLLAGLGGLGALTRRRSKSAA